MRPGAEGLIEIPPGTPTDIVGAEEVWASGGRVFVCPILPDATTGEKYSTSAIERKLMKQLEEWEREYDAPEGQVWVCGGCGKSNKNRVRVGDESCFLNAILCWDRQPWEVVNDY